jgi:H+/Cl- antiporter ClcA
METSWSLKDHWTQLKYTLRWTAWVLPVAALIGSVVAFFLWLLDLATQARFDNPWLLFGLPLAGIAISLAYHHFGGRSGEGTNLVMDEIHEPGGGVPFRLAPFVLFGTVITHLFGGSAGREGTAVQIGGSLSSQFGKLLGMSQPQARILMMSGVAAGFAAVFGTPLAGAVFAMEVLVAGSVDYEAILPCLFGAIAADRTCAAWGIKHTDYHIGIFQGGGLALGLDGMLALKVALAAAAFGLAGALFAEMTHGLGAWMRKQVPSLWLRPVLGAAALIALTYALGTRDYLGLGVRSAAPGGVSILSCFNAGGATPWSWLWKLLFTVITLSTGFKGGEVTPLFFIGAALGNALAVGMGAPVDLFAGLGFVAVFAGATNTPLACTLMGVELFGGGQVLYVAAACFIAYLFSGHSSIYAAQRQARRKGDLGKGLSHGT